MKRRKGLKRTGFKRKRPAKNRSRHVQDRDRYLQINWRCEMGCGERASEVHHIVQRSGDSIEHRSNYLSVCRSCHNRIHMDAMRQECIRIKQRKGEWLTPDEQRALFGRAYTDENGEWI